MTGQAHWLTLAIVFGGGFFVLLLGWAASRAATAGPHRHFVTRTMVCPYKQRMVDVTFVKDDREQQVTDVARCTAFPDPEEIGCKGKCADDMNKTPA
jgi:hypothetical protein